MCSITHVNVYMFTMHTRLHSIDRRDPFVELQIFLVLLYKCRFYVNWSSLIKQQKSWIFSEARLELHTIFVQFFEK